MTKEQLLDTIDENLHDTYILDKIENLEVCNIYFNEDLKQLVIELC